MQIFSFVVLSTIIALHNFVTPHISKTHLAIVSLNVREIKLNSCSKEQSRKNVPTHCVGRDGGTLSPPLPPRSKNLLNEAFPFHSGMRLPNSVQSK